MAELQLTPKAGDLLADVARIITDPSLGGANLPPTLGETDGGTPSSFASSGPAAATADGGSTPGAEGGAAAPSGDGGAPGPSPD